MFVKDINSQQLKTFSLVRINKAYKQEVPFFCSLLQACIDSYDYIINNSNLDQVDENPFLNNNITSLLELEKQILLKHNKAFIFVVNLVLLCYT